jgi:hypothetical protein
MDPVGTPAAGDGVADSATIPPGTGIAVVDGAVDGETAPQPATVRTRTQATTSLE